MSLLRPRLGAWAGHWTDKLRATEDRWTPSSTSESRSFPQVSALPRRCENPDCTTRQMLGSFRSTKPLLRFLDLSFCSRECLKSMIGIVLRRELAGSEQVAEPYRHRLPLGLLMLSRKWITQEQLTRAIEHQKAAGCGKLGEWLIRTQGVDEQVVAQALAVQWGAPLLTLAATPDRSASQLLPRLFVEAFAVLPLRVAARKILYLAVEEQVDGCLNQAIEAMTGLKVEPGVMKQSACSRLREAVLKETTPAAKLFRTDSIESLEDSIAGLIADRNTVWSRLLRVKQYIWVRVETMELQRDGGRQIEDVIFTLPPAR